MYYKTTLPDKIIFTDNRIFVPVAYLATTLIMIYFIFFR